MWGSELGCRGEGKREKGKGVKKGHRGEGEGVGKCEERCG